MNEYVNINRDANTSTSQIISPQPEANWNALDAECIRINVAAAKQKYKGRTGCTVVARNAQGKLSIVWAYCNERDGDTDVEEAESIPYGLIKAKTEKWNRLVVQSRNKTLIDKINSGAVDDINIATQLHDIRSLRELFYKCSFAVIPISSNRLAKNIAKFAIQFRILVK